MTAEIAIMNRQAIVLAADSAVTVGRQRVWKTANKLFALSPHNDIAIMAFGAGDFVGFPWETVVKTFRSKTLNKKYETVKQCADDFIEFLRGPLFALAREEKLSVLVTFIEHIEGLQKRVGEIKSKREFRDKLIAEIERLTDRTKDRDLIGLSVAPKLFREQYYSTIEQLAKDTFQAHIPKTILKRLVDAMHALFIRTVESDYSTGIVIAGFGSNELFPSLLAYKVDGKHNGQLRAWLDTGNSHDCNVEEASSGVIIPFGQADIAILFLEGINSRHLRWLRRSLKRLLDDKADSLIEAYVADKDERIVEQKLQQEENRKVLSALDDEFEKFRDKSLVQPVMNVVATLPKEEMADMAEALVELTSLRRRVDSPLESVGGLPT